MSAIEPAGVVAFPNPIDWAVDRVTGFVGDAAAAGFEMVVGGLVGWVVDAVVWVVGGVFDYFLDASDPNVQADWFVRPGGPYAETAAIGATLMVGFVLVGVVQGALSGDAGGMLRRMALDLPASVVGIVGLVTITQALIRLTDALSSQVMANVEDDIADFVAVVTSLSALGGVSLAFVVFLLGLVTVLAGLILIAELTVRASLIYIVVALAPLVFAVQVWPALRGTGQKLLRLLVALILSKLAMAVALAVATSAAVGAGSGGEVTALPEPERLAEDPGGSVTQAVGILLAATAAYGLAAFMPFLVARLLPLAEESSVAQGVRSGPVRAAQQAMSLAYYAQAIPRLAGGLGRHPNGLRSPGPPGKSVAPTPSRSWLTRRPALPAGQRIAGSLPAGPRPMPPASSSGGTEGYGAGGRAGSGGGAGGHAVPSSEAAPSESNAEASGTGGTASGVRAASSIGLGVQAPRSPAGGASRGGTAGGNAASGASTGRAVTGPRVAPVRNSPVAGPPVNARPVPNRDEPAPPPWGSEPAHPASARRRPGRPPRSAES